MVPGGKGPEVDEPPSTSDNKPVVSVTVVEEEEPDEAEDEFPTLRPVLPPPTHPTVKSAEYVSSSVDLAGCPKEQYPEFAVIGRSNVGKSSLINMLTGNSKLAKVSKEAGKTVTINHFIVNKRWYLVDLPGYGFARRGKEQRAQFERFTRSYFLKRRPLVMVFLLVDSTIPPQDIDIDYALWLAEHRVPFTLVFTKVDKRKAGAMKKESHMRQFKMKLLETLEVLPPSIVTSAAKGVGRTEMLHFIASLRVAFEKAGGIKAVPPLD